MTTLEVLREKVLEELAACLLDRGDSGYRLLAPAASGVVGQVGMRIPFSFPARVWEERMVFEVRFRARRVGVDAVRRARQLLAAAWARQSPGPARHRYLLFSATGFTVASQRLAFAREIPMVDLSRPAFAPLVRAADRVATEMARLVENGGIAPFSTVQLRAAVRAALGTGSSAAPDHPELARIAAGVTPPDSCLLIGFSDTLPLVILMPESPQGFAAYLDRAPQPDIEVRVERVAGPAQWALIPADGSAAFRLFFTLPPQLADWLLGSDDEAYGSERTRLSPIVLHTGGRLVQLVPHLASA
ncbi:hypothetical protein [Kutzneria sp. NPDC052558]|uniref:hypothetical protein n=1 Tax=Kutzneria sp. NPDC052558 TaxID=3364121 RepID=UPI0037CBAF4D